MDNKTPSKLPSVFLLNFIALFCISCYLFLRYKYLNSMIPLWYVKPWGDSQLTPKIYIFAIPLASLTITVIGRLFIRVVKKNFLRYGEEMVIGVVSISNALLLISATRILKIASVPFKPLLNPLYAQLITPFGAGFLIVYLITPYFISIVKNKGIVTDPAIHNHPGMILKKPSARGGGLVVALALIIAAFIFVPLTKTVSAILGAVGITAIIGFLDDISNTLPKRNFKIFGNPLFRLLFLLPIPILLLLFMDIKIDFINNPFNGLIRFAEWKMTLGTIEFAPMAYIFTFVWILWIINMLSWSNGVDGQYSGIVGITAIMIALLSLRFTEIGSDQIAIAKLAAITAGTSFGLAPHNWHPSKIMWGYGATAVGIALATFSILTKVKIATSIIVLLVPFLDAVVTVARRIIKGNSPLKGDKGHLHHLLIQRGWAPPKIALFYWGTTAFFGLIALLSSEKSLALVILTLGGLVAFGIISLNLKLETNKPQSPQTE
jgi:UDP-GlcNAc:undecaprenyl-phosphate/decaprenyl-phosphate GlcNAc-1-phosphate transferase